MKTITLKVPEALDVQLQKLADRKRISKSRLIRETLTKVLRKEMSKSEPSAYDLMKNGLGVIDSGIPDLATNPKYMEGYGR